MYDTNKKHRAKIDACLKKIASIQSNQGIDSTDAERNKAKREIRSIWQNIRAVDKDFYNRYYES